MAFITQSWKLLVDFLHHLQCMQSALSLHLVENFMRNDKSIYFSDYAAAQVAGSGASNWESDVSVPWYCFPTWGQKAQLGQQEIPKRIKRHYLEMYCNVKYIKLKCSSELWCSSPQTMQRICRQIRLIIMRLLPQMDPETETVIPGHNLICKYSLQVS